MALASFDENSFRTRVNTALDKVKTILDNTRTPQWAADVPHEYEDKYLLAELLINSAISAQLVVLDQLGLNDKHYTQVREWAKNRSVTIRLKSEEHCKFLRKVEREVESDTKHVTNSTLFGTSKSYTVTKITEWFWSFNVKYELVVFMGNESEKGLVLQGRSGTIELKTNSENIPRPAHAVKPNIDLNILWLLQYVDESYKAKFSIDRLSKHTHTPRRNNAVEAALTFLRDAYRWADAAFAYINRDVWLVQADHGTDLKAISDAAIFVPVLPLFEEQGKPKKDEKEKAKEKEKGESRVVPLAFGAAFTAEQKRSIAEKFKDLSTVFTANDKLVSVAEAKISVMLLHIKSICQSAVDGVDYIEKMLYKQLVAAIGKEVTPTDFTNYQRFHNRKLFRPEYQPRPFCYAIRRPDHYPEGTLTIEAQLDDGALADPIYTSVCYSPALRPMRFSIDAATQVSFNGDRFLHGWVSHQFAGYSGLKLNMIARARQFSSFILLVGAIASADLFEPKYGIIIQNKDDLKIPLMLETIPTPKEFKDAIESLSPEQQRFAKGFRSMQLESTLFGVCVIQIKPQLEKLLKLPDDSLTKEIELTQDLMSLFIEYQIPSDLISYDGPDNALAAQKVDTVKGYVANMMEMLGKTKKEQIQQAKQEQNMRLTEKVNDAVVLSSKIVMSEHKTAVRLSSPRSSSVTQETTFGRRGPGGPPSLSAPPQPAPPPSAAPAPPPPSSLSAAPPALVPAPAPAPAKPVEAPKPVDVPKEVAKVEPKEKITGGGGGSSGARNEVIDYTKIPQLLESKFEQLDSDGSLRPTIISAGKVWSKSSQKALLASPENSTLQTTEQGNERNKTFDLLDALTKSGAITVDQAALHVLIAATHCFDKSLMDTVIQGNINPIEKVERSSLIVASTIQQRTPAEIILQDQVERIATYSPMLIEKK